MEIVRVRRVGNSNVVSLPRSLERHGYVAGTQVVMDLLPTGEVVLRPAARVQERIRAIGRQVVEENREALEILASYDRGKTAEKPDSRQPS